VQSSFYIDKIVKKPWGEEHICYHDKKKIGITFVKINPGFQTSLHCHPTKKTGFVILSGAANVQIGLYEKNIINYKPLSILVLRPGLFHQIRCASKKPLYALETETPFKKNDLVRFDDNYGRKAKSYENQKELISIISSKYFIFNNNINKETKYKFNKIKFKIKTFKTNNSLTKTKNKKKTIAIILDGSLIDQEKRPVIKHGEIVKFSSILLLSKFYKIRNKLKLLIIN